MTGISLRLEITAPSKEFLDSAEWAFNERVLSEEEVTEVVADEIVSNVRFVEE